MWEYLGLGPKRGVELVPADGTTIRRGLSEAIIELPGCGKYTTLVILGESEDENLLGTATLEICPRLAKEGVKAYEDPTQTCHRASGN